MAFTVTPTSGVAPYVLYLELSDKVGIDQGFYYATFKSSPSANPCPLIDTGNQNSQIASQLIDTGSAVVTGTVEPGLCRTYTFAIRDSATNAIISQQAVSVSNI